MRTTVTLEADVAALLEREVRYRGISFKRAINDAIRAGLTAQRSERAGYVVGARSMGRPSVPLTKALRLADELEDEEIGRKLSLGK